LNSFPALPSRQYNRIKKGDKDQIFKQLVLCLSEIHSAGFVHRDIKPNNIMWDSKKKKTYPARLWAIGEESLFRPGAQGTKKGGSINYNTIQIKIPQLHARTLINARQWMLFWSGQTATRKPLTSCSRMMIFCSLPHSSMLFYLERSATTPMAMQQPNVVSLLVGQRKPKMERSIGGGQDSHRMVPQLKCFL